MARAKRHYYLIDNLTAARAETITRGLKAITSVTGVHVNMTEKLLEVISARNPDEHVRVACNVAGAVLRTKVKRK